MKAFAIKYLQRIFAALGVWGTSNDLFELIQSILDLF